ncbi:MAG TPA: hypothetical protein VI636_21605 [Candidatus Angelobacter sp.]
MPFDDPQEQENETVAQPFPLRPMYPGSGPATLADDDQTTDVSGAPSLSSLQLPVSDAQFQRRFVVAPSQATPEPSIGQRILALGQQRTPFGPDANGTTVAARGIGSSVVAGAKQSMDSWQAPRLRLRTGVSPASLDFDRAQQGIFGSFVPVGADYAAGEWRDKPTPAGSSMGSSPDQQPGPQAASGSQGGIVDASGLTKRPSKIRRPATAPEVLPNFSISNPQGLGKTLSGLMQNIRRSQPPQGTQPTVQSRGRAVTLIYPDGRREMRRGNHPQRDNNPGNMEAGAFSRSHGQIGTDKGFAVFPSPETGWAAMDSKLKSNKYWGLSVDDAVSRWAPHKNAKGQVINDTAGYQKKVRAGLGVTGDTKVSTLTPQQFETLKQAMARIEGFYESRPNRKMNVVAQPAKPRPAPRKK